MLNRRQWLAATAVAVGAGTAFGKPGRIPLGFSLYGMKSLPIADAIVACAKIGYDGVELALMPGYACEPKALDAAARKDLKKRLSDSGLSVMGLMLNLNEPADEKQHAINLAQITAAAELGHALADPCPPIETILGGKPAQWAERKDKLVESLQSWAKAARAANVIVAIKPHAGNALHTPQDAVWLVEKVNSPNIKLAYDYSHFVIQDMTIERTMAAILPHAAFAHVKDAKGTKEKFEFLLPGEEGTNYTEYVKQMTALKYGGPVIVEVSAMISNKKDYDPIAAAKKSYTNLAKAFGR